MNPDDTDLMLARAQIRLAYMLIAGILILAVGTLVLAFYNDKFSSLATTLATGALTLAGTAAAYFLSRQRPPTLPDPTAPPAAPTLKLSVNPGDPNAHPPSAPSASATATAGARDPLTKSIG